MKTLGELIVGDEIYIISKDNDYIVNVEKRVVSVVYDIKIGEIIKYLDEDGDLHAFTLKFKDFSKYKVNILYETIVCTDKEYVYKLLNEDKIKFLKIQNNILNQLDKDE